MPANRHFLVLRLSCAGFILALAAPAYAQQKPAPVPVPSTRVANLGEVPLADKLRSPRDTLQTLYYSIDVYDYVPSAIVDAVACLDLGNLMPQDSASAALLAVQLENVLNGLDIPLASVPDRRDGEATVTLYKADGLTIVVKRGPDGLWRFDRPTVERIPDMFRTALARQKNLQAGRAALRESYTDARATMRRFMANAYKGDFTAAAQALDLSSLTTTDRRERGPALAQMLAFVLQRRGYTYSQLLPDNPDAPPVTWHADRDGRIVLERIHPAEGKDAWLFNRHTVSNLPRMYAAAEHARPDICFVRLNLVVPPLRADGTSSAVALKPDKVPARLGSPRELLRGFFRAMDSADTDEGKLTEALDCMDLGGTPEADRRSLGATLAGKLEAVLRGLHLDLSGIPDAWDAAPQTLTDARGLRVDLVRQKDGCWRVNDATISRLPELFGKLDPKERASRERSGQYENARDTTATFIDATHRDDLALAGKCLDLSDYLPGAWSDIGPVLAAKLKYVLDRTGRVYIQEVPDDKDSPRYSLYRGTLGQIALARKVGEPRAGAWLFTPDTVDHVEAMFRAVAGRSPDPSLSDMPEVVRGPSPWEVPGVWLRLRLPAWAQRPLGPLDAYQWAGLVVAFAASSLAAGVVLGWVLQLLGWLLRKGASNLSPTFVSRKLRPLTWLAGLWLFSRLLVLLDLPADLLDNILSVKKFLLAGLIGWFGCRLVDLVMAVYSDSELMRPHRSLGDMIAPVTVKTAKTCVVLLVMTYVIYQIGQANLLGQFLTGLGVAGFAASLAAQDALKSFFGTLLLIGERSFKIGDRIVINGQEGLVEQVGFRATRLRTPDDSLLTIPNSTIAAASINNKGGQTKAKMAA